MKNKLNEKIIKINNEHNELLNLAHENIVKSNNGFNENVAQVMQLLNSDEAYVKKYTALVNVEDLIADLTEQIINTNDKDEIIKLRRKLNSYIRKIKEELENRNVSSSVIENFQAKSTYLRKDIARFIRYKKREANIELIHDLYSRYDSLSVEELELLKKSLNKENTYNVRNKKELKEKQDNILVKPKESENKEIKPIAFAKQDDDKKEKMQETKIAFAKTSEDKNEYEKFNFQKVLNAKNGEHLDINLLDKKSYIVDRIAHFTQLYDIKDTLDYQKQNFGNNIISFIYNLPRYIHNKKSIKQMKNDYYIYYRGKDFKSFIRYSIKRNSIKNSLKCIFSGSYLYSNELIYLNNHQNCYKWIYNSCVDEAKLQLAKS